MATIQRTSSTGSTRSHDMYVSKRDGRREVVSFDKIQHRIRTLGRLQFPTLEEVIRHPAIQISQSQRPDASELDVNYTELTMKVIDQMYDGISTIELDTLTAEQCASLTTTHPDYGVLASRVVISNHHKNTTRSFHEIIDKLYHHTDIHGNHAPIVSQDLFNIVEEHHDEIQGWIDFNRDYLIDFFGFKTLERAYLLRYNGAILERPQHMWLRVALGIHGTDLVKAKETYDMMSLKYFTHATPTLFNAGTPRPQMSSCYLIAMESDSIDGIYGTLADCARISKWAGGIGLHIHNIRAKGTFIRGTNGTSNGIVPMLRVFNNTARYVDQCFTAETHVMTDRGMIPIADIIPNETCVITGSGQPYLVKELIRHDAMERIMMDVYVEGLDTPLKVTMEHLMLVYRNKHNTHPATYSQDEMVKAYCKLLENDDLADVMHMQTQNGTFAWVAPIDLQATDWCVSMKENVLLYQRVEDTKPFHYKNAVYDLLVDKEHHYRVNTGVVHNGGGKRAGSFAIYLEPWHADVLDFLEMRKNHGDEESKARDLFYALWIPDLFMKRVEENKEWTLMCPDECPRLSDVYGNEFVELYEKYEREGKGKQTIPARKLWLALLDAQIETGTPYMLYKDAANAKSNQKNLGVIKSSNLCVAPETKVLTDTGYHEIHTLVNQHVNVWNGEEYSTVRVYMTGANQTLMRVTTDDGNILDCTPYHKFYIDAGQQCVRIDAKELRVGMRIITWKDPTRNGLEMHQRIASVEYTGRKDNTYCFTEPLQHRGVFNGILAGNCTEIIEYSDDKETAVCNLGSIALPRFVRYPTVSGTMTIYSKTDCPYCKMAKTYMKRIGVEYEEIILDDDAERQAFYQQSSEQLQQVIQSVPQIWYKRGEDQIEYVGGYEALMNTFKPTFDFALLERITRILTYNLNNVIDINFYPTEKTRRSNMRHRPIGMGVQGLADTFALMNIPFDSKEARSLNEMIFETMYYAGLCESCEIAKQVGAYETFEGSPAHQGKLQFDLWNRTPTMKDGAYRYDWNGLKADIQKYGLRNSLLVAPMPTASTSQILGYNECFEPFTSNIYMRRTLAGEFVIINKYLLRELIDLGKWNKTIKNQIIMANGSIQQIREIPKMLRDKYKIVWELSMKTLIDLASDRGAYVCQSQSMNLWMASPNYKSLTSMHFYAWKQGLKTGIYYLRTKAKAQAQQFTVDPSTTSTAKTEEDEGCLMCSG